MHKHTMAFIAYNPIARGFLTKSKASLTEAEGRFREGQPPAQVYNDIYNRFSFVEALDVRQQIAVDEKISRSELAYR